MTVRTMEQYSIVIVAQTVKRKLQVKCHLNRENSSTSTRKQQKKNGKRCQRAHSVMENQPRQFLTFHSLPAKKKNERRKFSPSLSLLIIANEIRKIVFTFVTFHPRFTCNITLLPSHYGFPPSPSPSLLMCVIPLTRAEPKHGKKIKRGKSFA